jgi:AraC-like DNA-binding protein
VVRAQSGHTASEHIDNFIITEAKQLIRSKQYTILQISEMLNFTCQSFFGRYFKKHTGFSPTAYQQLSLF